MILNLLHLEDIQICRLYEVFTLQTFT
jgi:hypothetical protein